MMTMNSNCMRNKIIYTRVYSFYFNRLINARSSLIVVTMSAVYGQIYAHKEIEI
jgi:hypothetical protein